MYKMIDISDVEYNEEGEVTFISHEVIAEMDKFILGDKQKEILETYCIENNIPYGSYSVVEYEEEKPVAVVGQFFYHSDKDKEKELETFLDVAEYNERYLVSKALGVDLVLSEETKKKYNL